MKTIILATLLVAPLAMADVLPIRYMQDKITISGNLFIFHDKSGREYRVRTDCDMDKVTTFKTKSKAIREGTRIRIAKDQTCRVTKVKSNLN